jgi:hypothetical protein
MIAVHTNDGLRTDDSRKGETSYYHYREDSQL